MATSLSFTNAIVFFSPARSPYNFSPMGVTSGHAPLLGPFCRGQCWSKCSIVLSTSSSPLSHFLLSRHQLPPPPPSSSFFFHIPYSSISLHLLRYLPFFHIPHITSLSISSSISPPPSPHHPSSSISSPSSSSSFPPAPRSFPPPPSPSHLLLLSLLQVDLSFLTDRISSKKILFSNAFSSS